MNMRPTPDSIADARTIDDRGPVVLVTAAMIAMLFVALGANAPDVPASEARVAPRVEAVAAAPALSESEWNEREDVKAGSYVGLPGTY